MKLIKGYICKLTVLGLMTFILSAYLPPQADAAVSKPVRIEQLSNSGGFFRLSFLDRIHPSLPGFSFDIYAISLGKGAVYQARRIIVTETATKNPVQEISLLNLNKIAEYPSTSEWETMGFIIEDMNFDGYKDIRIVAFITGGPRVPYFYWFWDNKENMFVRNTVLEEITAPSFDPVTKTIRSAAYIDEVKSYDIVYKYVNSVPVTKEEYLKNIRHLEQLEANLSEQNAAEKKKTLNNCYKAWNKELKNILNHLTQQATPEMKNHLNSTQKSWLAERERSAKEAAAKQPDNSSLAYTQDLLSTTKSWTLELIDIFFDGEKK